MEKRSKHYSFDIRHSHGLRTLFEFELLIRSWDRSSWYFKIKPYIKRVKFYRLDRIYFKWLVFDLTIGYERWRKKDERCR